MKHIIIEEKFHAKLIVRKNGSINASAHTKSAAVADADLIGERLFEKAAPVDHRLAAHQNLRGQRIRKYRPGLDAYITERFIEHLIIEHHREVRRIKLGAHTKQAVEKVSAFECAVSARKQRNGLAAGQPVMPRNLI